ncbi:MAG: class II glutamine amidotransferase [Woeseiaceae bacterium]|nr:class II glutamine amidotransferase [Woeseiaceae bacterium]
MCRFVMYMGPAVTLGSLVTEPEHSLIRQSYKAAEREEPLNGDGFGVAWYTPSLSERPGVFKDVSPAWNNLNLLAIAPVISSECLMAHVRAATPGLPVSQRDCHPFTWQRFAFMHNGEVAKFADIRRPLRRSLSDRAYRWIQGGTDTEHLFALFIDQYEKRSESDEVERIFQALRATVAIIEDMTAPIRGDARSTLNLVVTDGSVAVVTRYSTKGSKPETLYVHRDHQFECDADGRGRLVPTDSPAVLVASEPLTRGPDWRCIDPDHAILVRPSREHELRPFEL